MTSGAHGDRSAQLDRLPYSFHQTLSFDRSRLLTLLEIFAEEDASESGLTKSQAGERNAGRFGKPMVEAMVDFGRGCGFLAPAASGTSTRSAVRFALTDLGKSVLSDDPSMTSVDTQWLMHGFMAGQRGPGPAFWNFMFGQALGPGDLLGRGYLEESVGSGIDETERAPRNREAAVTSALNCFVGFYATRGGLSALQILETVADGVGIEQPPSIGGRGSKQLRVRMDAPPISAAAFGVLLIDFWRRNYPDRLTIGFDALHEDGAIARVLLLGRRDVEALLGELRTLGLVDLYTVAPPFQVVRRWEDDAAATAQLVDRVYAR
jgi:hypothetical protein